MSRHVYGGVLRLAYAAALVPTSVSAPPTAAPRPAPYAYGGSQASVCPESVVGGCVDGGRLSPAYRFAPLTNRGECVAAFDACADAAALSWWKLGEGNSAGGDCRIFGTAEDPPPNVDWASRSSGGPAGGPGGPWRPVAARGGP
eukprot:gene14793-biopygen11348